MSGTGGGGWMKIDGRCRVRLLSVSDAADSRIAYPTLARFRHELPARYPLLTPATRRETADSRAAASRGMLVGGATPHPHHFDVARTYGGRPVTATPITLRAHTDLVNLEWGRSITPGVGPAIPLDAPECAPAAIALAVGNS